MSSKQQTELQTVDGRWKWWAAASSAQTVLGTAWCRRGYSGTGACMPLKAFAAASVFVSAAASAVTSVLLASGFHSMEDAKEAGRNVRRWMRAPPKETAN
ncbi:hypothetical protein LUZ60_011944 [Juncus effusus]|nr:hypothetical protein LUZ60_011944 [Juncus effusus]